MSDQSQGPGWWIASDGKWYPPELLPSAPQSPPAPLIDAATQRRAEPTSAPPERRRRGWRRCALFGGLGVVALGALGAVFRGKDDDPSDGAAPTPSSAAPTEEDKPEAAAEADLPSEATTEAEAVATSACV